LVLTGLERVSIAPGDTALTPLRFDAYPFSHSLVAVTLWAALLGGLHWRFKHGPRTGALIGLLVLSHWALDFVSHRPDLPLFPGRSPLLGLGLWNSVPATLAVEGALFLGGTLFYLAATRGGDAVGRYGFLGLVGFLVLAYTANVLGPPPPSPEAVAFAGVLGAAITLPWAVWVDRHRGPNRPKV
jgi:hypothetical protein